MGTIAKPTEHQQFVKHLKGTPIELVYGHGEFPVAVEIGWLPIAHYKQMHIGYTMFIQKNLNKLKGIHILDWKMNDHPNNDLS